MKRVKVRDEDFFTILKASKEFKRRIEEFRKSFGRGLSPSEVKKILEGVMN